MPEVKRLALLALAACSAADPPTEPGIHDSWGTRQSVTLVDGAETIENYLVLGEDGTMRRYFRVKEAPSTSAATAGQFETTSAACAMGRYSLEGDMLTANLVVTQTSKFADDVVTTSSEQARARLVGPQLRVERIDQGSPAPVLVYDRLPLPADLDECSNESRPVSSALVPVAGSR